jgi:hypothetical protein
MYNYISTQNMFKKGKNRFFLSKKVEGISVARDAAVY